MADTTTIVDEADIPDVSLLDTPDVKAEQSDDKPGDTADNKPNEGADAKEESDDAKADESGDAEKTDEAKAAEGDESQEKDGNEQQPAPTRQEAAQNAFRQRQRNREQIAQQLDTMYGPKTEEELIDQGVDPNQAPIESMRQELAYKEERTRISELNAGMRADAVEVTRDFPIFDEKSKEYDAEFAAQVAASYQQAARLQEMQIGTNPDGSPITIISNADLSLYDHYQQMNNIYQRGTSRGARQMQSDNSAMMARTENPGGSSSANGPAAGSLEEMESRLGDVVIT